MRKLLIFVSAGVGLAGLIIGLIYLLLDVNQFRPTIQAELQKQLRRPVSLGEMSLGLFPLAIRVNDVSVGENPQFPSGRPFVTAKKILVRAELMPLLRKEVHVDSVTLTQPVIELVKNDSGLWNYSDLTNRPASGGSSPVSLSLVQVEDGTLAASELGKPASRSVYEHVNVEAADIAPGQMWHAKVTAQLPGAKSDSVLFTGSGGPFGTVSAPVKGKVSLTDAPLSGLARFSGSTLPVDGRLSGTAEFQLQPDSLDASLRFELQDGTAEGKPLGFPVSLNGTVKSDPRGGLSRFSGSVQAGKVPIGVSGEVDLKASAVSAAIKIQDASLTEVLGLARLTGSAHATGTGVISADVNVHGTPNGAPTMSGTASLRNAELSMEGINKPLKVQNAAIRFERDTANISNLTASLAATTVHGSVGVTNFAAPRVGFDLAADQVNLEELEKLSTPAQGATSRPGGKRAQPTPLTAKGSLRVGTLTSQGLKLTNVLAQCALEGGIVTLSPFSAEVFGGTQTGTLRADTRQQPPGVDLSLKMKGVDANQLLSAVSSTKNTLYGQLAALGEVHVAAGAGDLARALNGKLNLSLTKGRLAGTSVLNELSSIGKFVGLNTSAQKFTNISRMGGDIAITSGVASTDNLQMAMDGGSLSAAGTASLVDQSLNLKVTAVLDQSISRQAGGTRIGGYLTTALANGKGELVIPANVTGTFAQPHFSPDTARLAELKLRNVLPTVTGAAGIQGILSNPKGAGRSILDALSGKPQSQAGDEQKDKTSPENSGQPTNGVQGIIDIFRKKK